MSWLTVACRGAGARTIARQGDRLTGGAGFTLTASTRYWAIAQDCDVRSTVNGARATVGLRGGHACIAEGLSSSVRVWYSSVGSQAPPSALKSASTEIGLKSTSSGLSGSRLF